MSGGVSRVLLSSVMRKQLIAVTGLAMVGFVVAHLSGNLLIFAGPEVFNAYAHALASLGALLWFMRLGLLACVVVHVWLTLTLVMENLKARPVAYYETADHGDRKWATRTMKYSGILILLFILIHLNDFTFADKSGAASVIAGYNNDESLGLFGLVWNSYTAGVGIVPGWMRVALYVLAVSAVGLHLSHAIQSVFQTFGLNHERYTPFVHKASIGVGVLVAVGFGCIPVLVMLAPKPFGV